MMGCLLHRGNDDWIHLDAAAPVSLSTLAVWLLAWLSILQIHGFHATTLRTMPVARWPLLMLGSPRHVSQPPVLPSLLPVMACRMKEPPGIGKPNSLVYSTLSLPA
jgi:hypothetical protein